MQKDENGKLHFVEHVLRRLFLQLEILEVLVLHRLLRAYSLVGLVLQHPLERTSDHQYTRRRETEAAKHTVSKSMPAKSSRGTTFLSG